MFKPSVFVGIRQLVIGNDGVMDRLAEAVAERITARVSLPAACVTGPSDDTGSITPRLLTVTQAAKYLGRSKAAVNHLISSGTLPVVRHDKRVFLDREDLNRWIDNGKSSC